MKTKKLSTLLSLVLSVILMMSTLCLPASAAKSISKATVSVATAIYSGKALKPTVKVKLSGKTLSSKYYTVSYKNNTNIGKGTVTVKGKNGYSGSVKKTFKILPNKVTGVKATAGSDSVKLSWKAVKGATHYQVYMYEDGSWVRKTNTKSLSYTVDGLKSGATYTFKVRAFKKVSGTYYTGSFSSSVKATTTLPAPKNFKATADEDSITLSWSKVSKANYYQLWIHDGDSWSAVSTSKNKYTFSDLKSSVTYTFRVRAYIKSGSTKTYGAYTSKIKSSTSIGAVTSLDVSDITTDSAVLSWKKVTGADSYTVTLTDENGKDTSYTTAKTSYTLASLDAGTVYTVKVKAYSESSDKYGKEASASFASAPEKPVRVITENISETTADVCWTLNSGATGSVVYLLTLDKTGETLTRVKFGTSSGDSYTADNLEGATKYRFQIYSYVKHNSKNTYSEPSYSEIFTTRPGKVKNLKALTSKDTISLSWTSQSGAAGYEVYDGNKVLLKELTSDKQIYTAYSLEEGKSYTFFVRTFILNGNGEKVYGAYTEVTASTGSSKLTAVTFTKKTSTMSKGETFKTEVKIEPADAENANLIYKSSHVNVAMIDSVGTITAVANGSTKITVSNEDGTVSDSFTLTVEDIKLQSVSVNSSYEAYVNESVTITPKFEPANASDKSFTLSGSDYTYSYKGGFLGTSTKTDTCKFDDYFFIDNQKGRLLAKKATVEPQTGNTFSFTVTLRASNGKTATFRISAANKLISIFYDGEDNPWYYGNSAKLSAEVSSNAGFRADSLKWSSSNNSVATVSADGTVKCVGTGEVTITATAPVGTKSSSITFYVREVLKLRKDYYENCTVGENYQLNVDVKPSSSGTTVLYLSSDPTVATVSDSGKVTFKKDGSVSIYVSSSQTDTIKAVLTTGSCTLPSGSKAKLLSAMEESANKIKTQMPALYMSTLPTFTNVKINKEGKFKSDDLIDIFKSIATSKSRYIPAVNFKNYPSQTEYDNAYSSYLSSVPVSGEYYTIIPGLEESDIKSIQVVDNGSYTYDIKLTLHDELMAEPPKKLSSTAHGKVFDILASEYMEIIQKGFENSSVGSSLEYSAFKQTYNNSSLTISYDKVTGKITNMKYDMNVSVEIVDLKLTMTFINAIDSTVTFDVNNLVNYEVKY